MIRGNANDARSITKFYIWLIAALIALAVVAFITMGWAWSEIGWLAGALTFVAWALLLRALRQPIRALLQLLSMVR